MRVNMGREGRASSSLSANGGSMLGSLILANSPSQPLEAATKYYVDTVFTNLSANNILNGTLPISSLPSFTGDATTSQGSNSFTLANIGVTPGSYAKVIVDAKGRVTGNDILVGSDIPNFNWDKVSGDPVTIDGYGITDALKNSGGELTGNLSVGTPTQPMSIVNKQYVDSALSNNSAVVGDVIRKPYASTPTGFLRCNGGLVDKVLYADLYNVIGDNFASNTVKGSGQPWKQQYQINSIQSADISGWSVTTALPAVSVQNCIVVTKNRVYVLGGWGASGPVTTVYTAPINDDGTLGTWTTGTALPIVSYMSQTFVTKNRVYLVGGSDGNTTFYSSVYTAEINVNGTLGAWTTAPSLPNPITSTQTLVTKNRVYLIGGHNGTNALSTVYTAPINSDGTIGSWSTSGNLPGPFYFSQLAVTKNRVYLLGGNNGTADVSTVYTAPINTDGTLGTWTTGISLPGIFRTSQVFVTKNRVYLCGGYNGSAHSSVVYTASIHNDGTLGTWTTGTSLPVTISAGSVLVTNSRIYLIGGVVSGAYSGAIYTATVYGGLNDYSEYYSDGRNNYMMPGSGRPWQQQYQINVQLEADINNWASTTSLPGIFRDTQAIVTKNRVYLIGGNNGSTNINTVYTAPINNDGTLGSWTTDVALPGNLGQSTSVVTKNRVYLLGGHNGSGYTSVVYTAQINADGTLGLWGTGTPLPNNLSDSQAIVTKNRVYLLGGFNGSAEQSAILTAPINEDGTLGGWMTYGSLPVTLMNSSVVITKNRIYLLGGWSNANVTSVIYTASINEEGLIGTWSTAGNIPVALFSASVYVVNRKVYLIGGRTTGSTVVSTVYVSHISADGVLGNWTTTYSLPGNLHRTALFTTNSRIYLCGGDNSNAVSTVYTGAISFGIQDYSNYYNGTISTTNIPNYLMPGSGKPWQQQYQINTTQSADITGWTTGTALPGSFGYAQAIVTKNRVYLIAGENGAPSSIVYTASINADGTLGSWSTDVALPGPLTYSQAIVTKNRVYLIGGFTTPTTATATIYTAPINADGTLGTWVTGTSLPAAVAYSQAVVTKNRVYLLGGYNGSTYISTVYTAPINNDGTLGTWTISTSLPIALCHSRALVTKNKLYMIGGQTGVNTINNIYSASISVDGILGPWVTEPGLPGNLGYSTIAATKNRVYLFGGYSASYVTTVYTAPINNDGTLGTWTTGTSLPGTLTYSTCIIVNNNIYLLGGHNGSVSVSTVYTAPINSNINNDYSPYYDGTIQPVAVANESNLFALPDFSHKEKNGINIYIKH